MMTIIVTDNPSIRIFVENKITFKVKTGYYLKILTSDAMKLIRITKNKITKDENVDNVPYLKITEVVLVYWNIVNHDYQVNSRVFYTLAFDKSLGKLLDI